VSQLRIYNVWTSDEPCVDIRCRCGGRHVTITDVTAAPRVRRLRCDDCGRVEEHRDRGVRVVTRGGES
jgi:hypothetical protein